MPAFPPNIKSSIVRYWQYSNLQMGCRCAYTGNASYSYTVFANDASICQVIRQHDPPRVEVRIALHGCKLVRGPGWAANECNKIQFNVHYQVMKVLEDAVFERARFLQILQSHLCLHTAPQKVMNTHPRFSLYQKQNPSCRVLDFLNFISEWSQVTCNKILLQTEITL